MHRPNAKFRVRDEVIITDVKKCAWGSNKHMEAMIGSVVTIASAYWSDGKQRHYYKLREDSGGWTWDDSCFEINIPDLPEFDVSGANLLDLFS